MCFVVSGLKVFLFYFCCSFQVCVTKAMSIYKMQFLVELLVDIKIL